MSLNVKMIVGGVGQSPHGSVYYQLFEPPSIFHMISAYGCIHGRIKGGQRGHLPPGARF